MRDKIAENPSFKKLENQLNDLKGISKLMPWLLNKEDRQKLTQTTEELCELRTLPDRFNSIYLQRGWVCFDSMNADLIKRCVTLGENGNIEKGEQELIDYYQGNIRHLVYPLRNLCGFKERYDLLQKALDDYANNRYHACVPIFLMIIDGAVNQVLKKNQGLFAQDVNLTLFDSIIGHEEGLSSLIQLMSKTRKKTTVTPIDIPYRNGILHGMDVCYDNVTVATKALSTLLAVAEWVKHFCDNKHTEPTKEKPQSIKEIYEDLKACCKKAKEIEIEKKMLNEWKPRDFSYTDFSTYKPIEGTPEYKIVQFMEFYKSGNYGKMAEMLIDYSGKSVGVMAGKIRTWIGEIRCISYQIVEIKDSAPAISEISLQVTTSIRNEAKQIEIKSRLIYQIDRISSQPLVRGTQGGEWYIIDHILYNIYNQTNTW